MVWFDRVREKEKSVSKIWIVWIDGGESKGKEIDFLKREKWTIGFGGVRNKGRKVFFC